MIINQKVTDDIKSYIQDALVENCDKEKLKKWKKVIKYSPSKKRKQGLQQAWSHSKYPCMGKEGHRI